MGDLAIRVSGLSKQYRLGATQERYVTLRDQVQRWAKAPLRALLRRAKRTEKRPPFWALKDVSFEVTRGEVVGIIGRNGAGKSTLLKILSRITEPTDGEVDIHGRVGSLLEVGTGFHPELTGRENVYLNGAILGMRRAETVRKFDEIVAFAEVEKFIDTPVKHYSSGMYTRLAFAVAAHLEPEILIVDEVLAVGDAEFQRKCLGKMGEVAKGGRTVLFVSHNMAAINSLCSRAIVLNRGSILKDGPTAEALSAYFNAGVENAECFIPPDSNHPLVRFDRVYLSVDQTKPTDAIDYTDAVSVVIELTVKQPARGLRMGIIVGTPDGMTLFGSSDYEISNTTDYPPGQYVSVCRIPGGLFNAGDFYVGVGCDQPPTPGLLLMYDSCLRLSVSDLTGHGPGHTRPPGVIRPAVSWERTYRSRTAEM